MPELPEVETIRRGLAATIIGKYIKTIEIRLPRLFKGEKEALYGSAITDIRRFGKGLVIDFDNGLSVAAHVKMTGQFVYRKADIQENFHPTLSVVGALPNKWTHIIIQFSDGSTLFYNDIRQFGWLHVIQTESVNEHSFFKNLGKEPFTTLTQDYFLDLLFEGKGPIKSLLMDQRKIAGVGNIYASEALFVAGIHPERKASSLTKEEGIRLYQAILQVLQKGLDHKGASETNFIHVDGSKGEYQHHFLVYGRKGKPCHTCHTFIERVVIAGRSSFYCPTCQT